MGAFCVLIVIIAVVFMVCEELFSDFKYSSFLLKERREREKKIKRFEDLPEEEQQKCNDFWFRERARGTPISRCRSFDDPVFKAEDFISSLVEKKLTIDLENFKSQFVDLPFFGLVIAKCPYWNDVYLKDKDIENCLREYIGSVNYKSFSFENFPQNPFRDYFNIWCELEIKELCEKHNKEYDYDLFDMDEFYRKSKFLTVHLIKKQEPGSYCWDEIDDEVSKKQYLDTYSKLFLYFEKIRKEVLNETPDRLLNYYYKDIIKYIPEIDVFTYCDD